MASYKYFIYLGKYLHFFCDFQLRGGRRKRMGSENEPKKDIAGKCILIPLLLTAILYLHALFKKKKKKCLGLEVLLKHY